MPEQREEAGRNTETEGRSFLKKVYAKMRSRGGFTLAELLMATMILALGGSIVVSGIPLAAEVCRKVVDYSNAQVLLSTTMTRLRDELGTAENVEPPTGKRLVYKSANGGESVIHVVIPGDSDNPGIYLREYNDWAPSSDMSYDNPLVSNVTADGESPKKLYMDFDTVAYNSSDSVNVVTFTNLKVVRDTDTLVTLDEYKIRVLK